jgi:uncharacterized protein YqjF (DUF2071 family)
MSPVKQKIFLSAQWKNLVFANYEIDPKVLAPYVPKGTELDYFEGKCYVSLVGFQFLETKVLGIKIPFHINFEEFNLRFYVKYHSGNEWKRGVVFIKELVPKHAIAWVADLVYHEPYLAVPMKHEVSVINDQRLASYYFKKNNQWHYLKFVAQNNLQNIVPGSLEEFITEHYWGYNRFNDTLTMEYEVEHPKWQIFPVMHAEINIDFKTFYPVAFHPFLVKSPASLIMAEGSEIIVRKGIRL